MIFLRTSYRVVSLKTKSSPEPISKFKTKKIGSLLKSLNEYDSSVVVFDDVIGSKGSQEIDHFSVRKRHIKLELFYIS